VFGTFIVTRTWEKPMRFGTKCVVKPSLLRPVPACYNNHSLVRLKRCRHLCRNQERRLFIAECDGLKYHVGVIAKQSTFAE
jgi:hypothetical protein